MRNSFTIKNIIRKSLYIYICVILVSTANAQIMYNKVKPVSLESQSFKQLQELPVVDFPIEQNGSMYQTNLNVNVKEKSLFESANGKNIARMFIKVNAQSLGNITVHFKDVLLNNNSYCLVYTQDHQIVAGPIYQKSINNNQFTIMNIPAAELILEVIYKDKNDFTMKLNEVSFESLVNLKEVKKKEKERNQLLSGDTSTYLIHNVINQNRFDEQCDSSSIINEGCGLLGHHIYPLYEYSNWSKVKGVNDSIFTNFNSNRSSCIVFFKDGDCNDGFPNDKRYTGYNGTLINLPSNNCDSYVVCSRHNFNGYYLDKMYNPNEQSWRDVCFVRFNWHYKYGIPFHLLNIDCSADSINFQKWRSTIDFDEVVDYIGLEPYLENVTSDMVVLKIQDKLHYKEYHMGFTTQHYFDRFIIDSITYETSLFPELLNNFFLLGSRTGVFPKNYYANTNPIGISPFKVLDSIEDNKRIADGINFSGYSGIAVILNNYIKENEQLFYGIIQAQSDVNLILFGINGLMLNSTNFFIHGNPNDNILLDYYENNNLANNFIYDSVQIYQYDDILKTNPQLYREENFIYNPSMENKEKCPSPVEPQNPCDFDINDYITYSFEGSEVCVKISKIPNSKFPDSTDLPKGYRIYHNYGDQKTEKWVSFQGGNDITFPIEFCIDKCRLAYLKSLGKDSAKIAIDFYDENGNIYNNPGCDTLEFGFEIKFCNLVDVSVELLENIGTCCKYEISIDMSTLEGCEDFNPGTELLEEMISDDIKFKGYTDMNFHPIQTRPMYSYDPQTKTHTFEYQVCNPSETEESNFVLLFEGDSTTCETEPIDLPACMCDCPEDIDSWVTLTATAKEPPCAEDECKVSGEFSINIPSIYNCYTKFTVNDSLMHTIADSEGEIPAIQFSDCIFKEELKEYTFKFFKDENDTVPCIVRKAIDCPQEEFTVPCTPDCDSVKWEIRYLDSLNLPGCPGCKVKVKYASRTNICSSPETQDIQILAMTMFNSTSDTNACQACLLTEKDIYKEAMLKIIHLNEMGFLPIADEDCNSTWRIIHAKCWTTYSKKNINLNDSLIDIPDPFWYLYGNKKFVPCDSVGCCSIGLEVCRFFNPDEHITVDTLGFSNSNDSCSNEFKVVWDIQQLFFGDTLQCNESCDWITNVESEQYFGRQSFIFEKESKEILNNEKLFMQMTQYENLLDFNVDSEFESNDVKISIHSLQGESIIENHYTLKEGKNQYHLHIDNLNSGFYLINFQIDGTILKTEKIIILR